MQVSHDPPYGATTIRASKRSSKFGGAKWLIGAAAAAIVVVGASYLAWSTYAPHLGPPPTPLDDPYAAEIAEPFEEIQLAASEDLVEGSAMAASTEAEAAPARRARAAPVPEATIGVPSAETDSEEIIVTGSRRPVWARTPSPRRLSALYPERALDRGREGEARLHCIVQDGGALDCERVSETSRSFGAAAVRVARTFRHAPQLRDGSDAVGTPVNLRVVFRITDEEQRLAAR